MTMMPVCPGCGAELPDGEWRWSTHPDRHGERFKVCADDEACYARFAETTRQADDSIPREARDSWLEDAAAQSLRAARAKFGDVMPPCEHDWYTDSNGERVCAACHIGEDEA